MPRLTVRSAALALSLAALNLGILATPARAEVLDQSNSASAIGDPFAHDDALTTRSGVGASPNDDSHSAAARGNPRDFAVAATQFGAGSSPVNDSNSASALGGPGTGPLPGTGYDALTTRLALNAR